MFKKISKISKLYKMQKRLIERREELIKLEASVRQLITVSCGEEEQQYEAQLRNLEDEMFLYTMAILDTKIEIEALIDS